MRGRMAACFNHIRLGSSAVERGVAYSEMAQQNLWRAHLKAVDEAAKARFGKVFMECDAASRNTLMAEWAKNEKAPKTELEKFFVQLKRLTAAGYYGSEIGLLKELGYKGNDVISDFPGCKQPCKICGS